MTNDDLEQGNWPVHFINEEAPAFWWVPYAVASFGIAGFGLSWFFWS